MAAEVRRNIKAELKFESNDENNVEMETENNLEEGEISDDDDCDTMAPLAEAEAALFDKLAEGPAEEPAKRFTLIGDLTLTVPKTELNELYQSLGIDEENERHYRFNTIHLRGTHYMKTNDVIDYFSGLEPAGVDWLEEGSCNVLWDDEILPARALLYLSEEIKKRRFKFESDVIESEDETESTGTVDAMKLKFRLPPGRWRKGIPCDKSKDIIMRYANKDDKKMYRRHKHSKRTKHKEIHVEQPRGSMDPWGPLAQSWGRGEEVEKHIWPTALVKDVPDLRSSLNNVIETRFADTYLRRAAEMRREKPPSPPVFSDSSSEDSDYSDDDFVRRRKLPKMHADREEEKMRMARLEAVAKTGDLRSRLNHKKTKGAPPRRGPLRKHYVGSDESGEDLSTEWANENYRDLKRTLANREREREDSLASESDDLKLEDDDPGEMLQIEIDNEYCQERRRRRH